MHEQKLKELSNLLSDSLKKEVDTLLQQPNSAFFYDHLYDMLHRKGKKEKYSVEAVEKFVECLGMFLDYYKIDNPNLFESISQSVKVSDNISWSFYKHSNKFSHHMRGVLFKIKRQKYDDYNAISQDIETGEKILQEIKFKGHSKKLDKLEKRKVFIIKGYLARTFRDIGSLTKQKE